jgi:hypothetical protein
MIVLFPIAREIVIKIKTSASMIVAIRRNHAHNQGYTVQRRANRDLNPYPEIWHSSPLVPIA